jgi:MFS family permease
MEADLNCTPLQAVIGLSVYSLGVGVVPLVSASFGEEFGRQPLYVVSTIGFSLMHLMSSLCVFLLVQRLVANLDSNTS